MYYVYILYSPSTDSFYKGQTQSLDQRLIRHNNGFEKATKHGRPWKLVWSTQKTTRSEAIKLESKLKNLNTIKLKKFILKYSESVSGPDDPDGKRQWCQDADRKRQHSIPDGVTTNTRDYQSN